MLALTTAYPEFMKAFEDAPRAIMTKVVILQLMMKVTRPYDWLSRVYGGFQRCTKSYYDQSSHTSVDAESCSPLRLPIRNSWRLLKMHQELL